MSNSDVNREHDSSPQFNDQNTRLYIFIENKTYAKANRDTQALEILELQIKPRVGLVDWEGAAH